MPSVFFKTKQNFPNQAKPPSELMQECQNVIEAKQSAKGYDEFKWADPFKQIIEQCPLPCTQKSYNFQVSNSATFCKQLSIWKCIFQSY